MKGGTSIISSSSKIETMLLMAVSAAIVLACCFAGFGTSCFAGFSVLDFPVGFSDSTGLIDVIIMHISSFGLVFTWAVICVLGYIIVSDSLRQIIPNRCVLALLLVWTIGKLAVIPAGSVSAAGLPCGAAESLGDSVSSAATIIVGIAGNVVSGLIVAGLALAVSVLTGKLLHKKTLGGGDIKLMFVLGLILGLDKSLIMLFVACIFGLITAVLTAGHDHDGNFAFGPAISIAAFIALLI